MPNALAAERSLYLRQHADNPVAWVPWSEEAFQRARQEQKPIFLSIGYSACHWCHVMERECFEDEEVAELLNRWFIPIKVDREERPDIDAVYMSVCVAATGHGGWPLTVILTPEKEPIFVGTYFPKRSTRYQLGLVDVLRRIHELWEHERDRLIESARAMTTRLAPYLLSADAGRIGDDTVVNAVDHLWRTFDGEYGGFGVQPKFPMFAALRLCNVWGMLRNDERARRMFEQSCQALRWGGIYDHVGYGVHRYSTDRRWFLPHFEKMLYDQALMLLVFAEGAASTGQWFFRRVAREVAEYLDSTLRLPCGAYAASEDADSPNGEGAYYRWRYDELRQLLSPSDFERFRRVFAIAPEGNARDEATGSATGDNILYAGTRTEEVLERFGGTLEEFFTWWDSVRPVLAGARAKRERPQRDEKILCDWNALAIVALARAGRLLNDVRLITRAQEVWDYLRRVHLRADGMLAHCSYDGEPTAHGFLDDYAFGAWGVLELYQATASAEYLDTAVQLVEVIERRYCDSEGRLLTAATDEVLRHSEPSDGGTVSAVGIAAYVNAALSLVLDDAGRYRDRAERILWRYGGNVERSPSFHTTLLLAYLQLRYGRVCRLAVADWQTVWRHLTAGDPLLLIVPDTAGDRREQPRATICTSRWCSAPIDGWEAICHAVGSTAESG